MLEYLLTTLKLRLITTYFTFEAYSMSSRAVLGWKYAILIPTVPLDTINTIIPLEADCWVAEGIRMKLEEHVSVIKRYFDRGTHLPQNASMTPGWR